MPGRQAGDPQVDTQSDAFKAGTNAAAAEFRAQAAEQEARHEAFVQSIGDMLSEMDMRYRRECLSLIERLFSAAAPTLAHKSSLADLMRIVEERVVKDNAELTLRVHPDLVEHLSDDHQRVLSKSPQITLKTDSGCAPSAIDARWEKGGLFHDPDAFIQDVLSALRDETAPQEEMRHD